MTLDLDALLTEYERARRYTEVVVDGLDDAQVSWRPDEQASGIGWHLGHQAAVNHYMVRNLTAAEPTFNARFDALFDSATLEPDRGDLPSLEQIYGYRRRIAASTNAVIERIADGQVGAPIQLRSIAEGLLRAVINHEYQHDTWILEVRETIGSPLAPESPSPATDLVEGYWILC